MPDAYQLSLGEAVFGPFAEDLARRAAALHPRRVLELAAGTAELTDQLLRRLPATEVIATDLSPAMVEYGTRRAPTAAWRLADAQELPLSPASLTSWRVNSA
jgi:ubiquinone/menaquinone biosynthesis C-methylase UbiE